ncbi:hypothetical protein CEXT_241391 [Caerostris extrusa]|uniref:Uncharacterized protein n=1 Tax=Caerostris extrusa TaxID=172846 RepID=A0AAV4TJN1_CAEEX|nr:hypothetical protein CEXT_241391 [Caerostris extrusa]
MPELCGIRGCNRQNRNHVKNISEKVSRNNGETVISISPHGIQSLAIIVRRGIHPVAHQDVQQRKRFQCAGKFRCHVRGHGALCRRPLAPENRKGGINSGTNVESRREKSIFSAGKHVAQENPSRCLADSR